MKMSYSRRELYALGEPIGDCATYCKADGGLVLGDGGGGGGSQPANTSQTTTQELPEWAKPYAKNTVEKASALTETPYQRYDQNRIAGFSPLQQQSQQGAANMQTNQLTGLGGGIAAGAGMGGLGYAMQQNPQNFQQNVGGYMNPYLQMSLAPQLAEANRNYDIGAVKQQSAATQAGAFGGSREAIMAAENERNRNMGLQNIIGQGYNTAFGNAQNQYNQSQQAQLQGLNTALQGAGQLGALGGQQFQQGMDINKLQNAYGGQQQALRQQGLDQAYQNFQDEKNYPYKQLGFMSDMIRGLPLGQQSTQQMYQAPGSMMGQLGGLGLGVYGLSKFMADGGLAYEEGGVTRALNDDGALAASMDKLTDEQLQQILQHPTTKAQLEAAQEEMAMRASERGGMASAYNQLPQGQQQNVVQAANGGILAFAKGGDEGEYFQDPMGAPSYEVKTNPFKQNVREGESYTPGLLGMMFGYNVLPKEEKAAAKTEAPVDTVKFDRATATRREDFMPKVGPKVSPEVFSGITKLSKDTGTSANSLMDEYTKMRDMLRGESKSELEALNKLVDKSAGRSDEIKKQGLGKALAEFGFQWAAAASKPGQAGGQGIRGAIQSAASAAPSLAASAAKTDELARAADDNYQKLALSMKQFELAQRKGDTTAALSWAQQVRQLQQTDKQIAMQREHYAAQAGLGQAQLAQREKQFGDMMSYRNKVADAQGLAAQARVVGERRKAMVDFDNANRRKQAEYIKELGPLKGDYKYQQERNSYIKDVLQTSRDQRGDMASATGGGGARSYFDLMDME
jgi:hypothetical protein